MSDWNEIRTHHGAALARVVASYAPPGPDRDDLLQEVAVAIVLALPRFRGEASLKTYVLRVAHNVGLRHAIRRRQLPEPSAAEVHDEGAGPLNHLLVSGDHERLHAAIRRLPIAQRQVLGLALEDLDHAAIGEALGITVNAVATRLHRAKACLRHELEKP